MAAILSTSITIKSFSNTSLIFLLYFPAEVLHLQNFFLNTLMSPLLVKDSVCDFDFLKTLLLFLNGNLHDLEITMRTHFEITNLGLNRNPIVSLLNHIVNFSNIKNQLMKISTQINSELKTRTYSDSDKDVLCNFYIYLIHLATENHNFILPDIKVFFLNTS